MRRLPDRDGMVYLERHQTKWPLRIQLPIGTQVPFHCAVLGKLYLNSLRRQHPCSYLRNADLEPFTAGTMNDPKQRIGHIDTIPMNEIATGNEEFMDGMIDAGVPIMDPMGRLVFTLSLHAPIQRLSLGGAMAHLPLLKEAAHKLSQLLSSDGV